MSSITANSPSPHFKFPPSPEDSNRDYFTLKSNTEIPRSPSTYNNDTIYEDKRQDFFQSKIDSKQRLHKLHINNDSISSVKSNLSELTLIDQRPKFGSNESYNSTTTLVDNSPKLRKEILNSPVSATDPMFQSRASISYTQVTPTRPLLVKYTTTSQHDISRFNPRLNRDMIYQLPQQLKLIQLDQLSQFIENSKFDFNTGLSNLIIIDVRPFGEFCKNHIKNSINICLSSTLLKRSSFNLKRCIDSLPQCDKLLFTAHLSNHAKYQDNLNNGIPCSDQGFPLIVLYDNFTEIDSKLSLSILYTASKFTQDKDWNSPIYILQGGYKNFQNKYSQLLSNQDDTPYFDPASNNNSPVLPSTTSSTFQLSFSTPGSSPASSTHSINSMHFQPPAQPCMSQKVSNSPVLARFVLPTLTNTVFKTRHNEEVMVFKPDFKLSLRESSTMSQTEQQLLPHWMLDTIGKDNGSTSITQKFSQLETTERDRLRRVFSTLAINDCDCPQISKGVELGNKNRYKDILPYEHSRVKLSTGPLTSDDYINASYISSSNSSNKYIATQGPLNGTIGDFWQLVISHHCPLILSLTAQSEDGVEKCAPFWQSGIYNESGTKIEVQELSKDENFRISNNSKTPMILRRLRIVINDSIKHDLLQLQVISWPDYGASIAKNDLLSLVELKKKILIRLNCQYQPIVVHCSAGCGRTGTFCAIDSTIDLLTSCQNNDNDSDPILNIVDGFRKQRISMVQTIRQYLLIYDTVLLFMKNKLRNINDDNNWINDDILMNFINDLSK